MADELRDCEDFLRGQIRRGGFGGRRFGGMDPHESYGGHSRFGGESRRLREIVREQQQRRGGYGEEREDLERIAENIPQMCGISPRRCDIRRGGYRRLV